MGATEHVNNKLYISYHQPVLLQEVVQGLVIRSGGRYIDATIGDGGHSHEILKIGGTILGIDRDPAALERARERLKRYVQHGSLVLVESNFDNIEAVATQSGFRDVDGIVFDLGVSIFHFTQSKRGFSFQVDEPLDMRLDPHLGVTAADLVNGLGKTELVDILTRFGQVRHAKQIVQEIVRIREEKPIMTTTDLVRVINDVAINNPRGSHRSRLHPATKVFMSLRIAVNDEFDALVRSLPQAIKLLAPGGRLAVISFHEGEDRIVKQTLRKFPNVKELTKRPIQPSQQEILRNPRSRSARLRLTETTKKGS